MYDPTKDSKIQIAPTYNYYSPIYFFSPIKLNWSTNLLNFTWLLDLNHLFWMACLTKLLRAHTWHFSSHLVGNKFSQERNCCNPVWILFEAISWFCGIFHEKIRLIPIPKWHRDFNECASLDHSLYLCKELHCSINLMPKLQISTLIYKCIKIEFKISFHHPSFSIQYATKITHHICNDWQYLTFTFKYICDSRLEGQRFLFLENHCWTYLESSCIEYRQATDKVLHNKRVKRYLLKPKTVKARVFCLSFWFIVFGGLAALTWWLTPIILRHVVVPIQTTVQVMLDLK